MRKIKLLGVKKSVNYSCYEFPKVQQVFEIIRALLRELRFQQYVWNNVGIINSDDPESQGVEATIEDWVDKRQTYEDEQVMVVVIYGKDKVFVSINSGDESTQKTATKTLNSFIKD